MARDCVADLEANGLLDSATTIWCIVIKDINTNEVFKFHHGQPNWEENAKEFMRECSTLIMHNGIGYDFPLLRKLWNFEYTGRKVDTLLISRLHNPDRLPPKGMKGKFAPHSVEAWGYRLGRGKPEHEDWTQFSEKMLHRCTEDVEIQHMILKALIKEGEAYNWKKAYSLTFKLFEILQLQEEYGWLVDKPYMDRCVGQLTTWINRIDKVIKPHLPIKLVVKETKNKDGYGYIKKPFLKSGLYSASVERWLYDNNLTCSSMGTDTVHRLVGGPFSRITYRETNLDSGTEVKDTLLKEGWQPKAWNFKKDPNTGRPLKDEKGQLIKTSPKLDQGDPFVGVEGKVGKLLAKRVQIRHRRSNIEGWIKSIRTDGRISGRVAGIASTGRMKHAGIVNVPGEGAFYGRQMRKCFISKEDFSLVSADAKSCQDRMLAERAKVQEFTDMLLYGDKSAGTDGHSLAMKAVNKVLEKLKIPLITRKKGKNLNFAWKFGASDNKLGVMVNKGKKEGDLIRQALRETFPAQASLVDELTKEWKNNAKTRLNSWGKLEYYNGWIKGLDGRPIFIESEHQILVYMLQSDEAIYMSTVYCIAYTDLCKRFKWGVDFGIVCFYHDEMTIEIKSEYSEEAAQIIEEAFTKASNYFAMNHCPQEGESEVGENWLEVH
jgi:DNA polymerase I-like protein with 3'-5' exonuclease and polymerase domains